MDGQAAASDARETTGGKPLRFRILCSITMSVQFTDMRSSHVLLGRGIVCNIYLLISSGKQLSVFVLTNV